MEMSAPKPNVSSSYRLIEWTPLAIAIWLIFSMMSDREELLYLAAVVGAVASIAVGRMSGKAGDLSVQARLWKFVKGWLLVVALAALSLMNEKWQPMVFFALVGAISSAFFWFGSKSSR